MSRWRTAGAVVAGTLVTVGSVTATTVVLPVVGFGVAELVGNWLPTWLFLLPVVVAAVLGGATTGVLAGRTPVRSAALGSLATGVGLAAIGAVLGLLLLLVVLGMTPAHGQETDIAGLTRRMVAIGSGAGFLSGTVFGAIGGAGGHIGRETLGS